MLLALGAGLLSWAATHWVIVTLLADPSTGRRLAGLAALVGHDLGSIHGLSPVVLVILGATVQISMAAATTLVCGLCLRSLHQVVRLVWAGPNPGAGEVALPPCRGRLGTAPPSWISTFATRGPPPALSA